MSDWIDVSGDYNGEWTNPAHWSGGIPSVAGSIANFGPVTFNTSQSYAVFIDEAADITVGQMTFAMTGTGGIDLRGSFFDSGTGIADLIFDNGASAAVLNVSQPVGSDPIRFLPAGGLRMTLASNLVVNTVDAVSKVIFDLGVSGVGKIVKTGAGRLELNDVKTFTGGFDIQGGTVQVSSDSSLGSGNITISNNADFIGTGPIDNAFLTLSGTTGTQGAARISGSGMILTGALHHLSEGTLTLGLGANGFGGFTASFSAIFHNPTQSSFFVFFIKIGNAYSAANLFNFAGTGTTQVRDLDTNGFVTTISNLQLSGSAADFADLQSTSGTLNVIINDVSTTPFAHDSSFISGTAGADSIVVNTLHDYNFSAINWNTWTTATDTITYNGSANANVIRGSGQRETFNGGAGNDTLVGNGGIDTMNGGSGNDLLAMTPGNQGSFIDGGADLDTLRISGGLITLGSLASIEKVNFQSSGVLILTAAQFATGLAITTELSGAGSVQVDLSLGNQQMLARSMTVSIGSFVDFTVNGSSGADVVKASIDTPATIFGNAGNDRLNGGDQVDSINGGNDIDKIRGDGGADILTGGAGADVFKYRAIADSGTTAGTRDTITDFVAGTDKLNFVKIDANASLAGDQAFSFINTAAFTNTGTGQIRWVDLGADLRVEVDVDGNGVADMHILLQGAGAQVLTSADFVL
jgi:autotransporter-associated beta strand protein